MKRTILPLILLLALLAGCAAPAAQEAPKQSEAPAAGAPGEAAQAEESNETGAVTVRFDGGSVDVQGAAADAVKVEGTAVTIRRSGTYILSGKSDSGSVKIKKDTGHVTLRLRSLELTADGTAAICCNKGSSLSIVAEAGTVNTLADTSANNADEYPDNADAENAVVKCKNGDLDFSGAGTLNIVANAKNGVKSGQDTGESEAFLTVNALELNVTAANDGIKSDGAMYLQSGSIRVSAADDAVSSDTAVYVGTEGEDGPALELTDCNEGVEAPYIDVCSGALRIQARDDGINAVSGTDGGKTLYIRGGSLYVDAAEGDGIDSNGEVTITGGDVQIFSSPRSDNAPLDTGSTFTLSGGTVLAVGAAGMAQSPNETGGQCYLSFGANGTGFGRNQGGAFSVASGDKIEILDAAGRVLAETTALRAADYVFYSSAALESGGTYTLRVGGKEALTAKATAEGSGFTGLPDMDGNFQGGFGGQRPEGFAGQRPEGMPELPEGELPEDFQLPEGFNGERPEGMEPPEGFTGRPGGFGGQGARQPDSLPDASEDTET